MKLKRAGTIFKGEGNCCYASSGSEAQKRCSKQQALAALLFAGVSIESRQLVIIPVVWLISCLMQLAIVKRLPRLSLGLTHGTMIAMLRLRVQNEENGPGPHANEAHPFIKLFTASPHLRDRPLSSAKEREQKQSAKSLRTSHKHFGACGFF